MVVISTQILMARVNKHRWEAAAYRKLLEELDKADYSSEEEKQTIRRYVEEALKRTGLGREEKVPKSLFLLA